jgi:transcriptional regulator with XRE-family HTH domain
MNNKIKEQKRIYNEIIGKNVKCYRILNGFNRSKLAKEIGVTHQQLQKYESGSNRISSGCLVLISKALDVDIMDFFSSENESLINEIQDSENKKLILEMNRKFVTLDARQKKIVLDMTKQI